MTDTYTDTTRSAVRYDTGEAEGTQQVFAAIALFREGLTALKAAEGAECNYEWEALLAACVDGQVALADFANGIAAFIGDCWPATVGNAADDAVIHARQGAYALAAVYGPVHAHSPGRRPGRSGDPSRGPGYLASP